MLASVCACHRHAITAKAGGGDSPLHPLPYVVQSQPSLLIPTSGFHPGFQVSQEQLKLAFIHLDDEGLGQLAEHRDGHDVFDLGG